jgi:hypothetical protein
MSTLKDYTAAAKALAAAEKALQAALDRLQAARDTGTADECVTTRGTARQAYKACENALHELERLRRLRWVEIARELRTEADAALQSVVRYRHALRASGQPEGMAMSLVFETLQLPPGDPPDDLGDVPYQSRPSPTLDRADETSL